MHETAPQPSPSNAPGTHGLDVTDFTRIFTEFQGPIYRYILNLTRNPLQADELTQQTLYNSYLSLHSGTVIDPPDNLGAWLFRIAHNTVISESRRSSHANVLLSAVLTENSNPSNALEDDGSSNTIEQILVSPDPYANIEQQAIARDELNRRLRAMEPKHREILILDEYYGYTDQEKAELLGLSVAGTKYRLRKAKEQALEIRAHFDVQDTAGGNSATVATSAWASPRSRHAGIEECLYLHEHDGLPYEEIARNLGITVFAARQRIYRARKLRRDAPAGNKDASETVLTDHT